MKKLAKLFLLALLPLGLVACNGDNNNESSEIISDTAIGEWTKTDLEMFAELNKDIVFPYDKEIFKAYNVETVDDNGDPVTRIDANYNMFYDYDIKKIVLNLTSEQDDIINSYVTYATTEDASWTLDSSLDNGGSRLVYKLSDTNYYFIDIFAATDTETLFIGYMQTRTTFNNVIKAFNFINNDAFFFEEGESKFVVPNTNTITNIALSDGTINGLYYIDLVITSNNENELQAYKDLLVSNKYAIDPAYESETRTNYYLIEEFGEKGYESKRCKDIMIDKVMVNNTFTMRLSLSDYA